MDACTHYRLTLLCFLHLETLSVVIWVRSTFPSPKSRHPKRPKTPKNVRKRPKTLENDRKRAKIHENGRNVRTIEKFDFFFQATSRPGLWRCILGRCRAAAGAATAAARCGRAVAAIAAAIAAEKEKYLLGKVFRTQISCCFLGRHVGGCVRGASGTNSSLTE